jgi:Adenylate and Guanylate cyclase catalytic domain
VVQAPSGTVTLLFTDIEGSTELVQQLGEGYGAFLNDHRRLLRAAVGAAGGYEVDCRADELFAAFQRAKDGVAAAVAVQRNSTRVPGRRARGCVYASVSTLASPWSRAATIWVWTSTARPASARLDTVGRSSCPSRPALSSEKMPSSRTSALTPFPGLPHPERIFQLLTPGL